MILKYTFRLIKSTFKRFFALLAIVFIGVSFMMGLRSNYDIMKESVEKYVDDNKLYDIQIYSNYGFDNNDLSALKKLDCVKDIFPSRTRDVYAKSSDGYAYVSRIIEEDPNLNKIELKEGRWPKLENECLIITSYLSGNVNIGETLSLYLENEDIYETLKNTDYKVVGVAKSVENMSKTFSSSNLDNKQLEIIIYIPNSNFISDYFTCMYIELDGAKELNSFTEEYKQLVDAGNKEISTLAINQSHALKDKIVSEATIKLEEGKQELEKQKADNEKLLEEGRIKLEKGKKELDNSLALIKRSEKQIKDSEKQLNDAQAEIDAGKAQVADGERQLNEAMAQIEGYGMDASTLRATIDSLYGSYTSARSEVDSLASQRDSLIAQRDEYQNIINASGYHSAQEVSAAMALLDPTSPEYAELSNVLNAFNNINSINNQINQINQRINILNGTLNLAENAIRSQFGFSDIDAGYQYIIDSLNQIDSAKAELDAAKAQLAEAQAQVDQGRIELESGKKELAKGKKEYEKGLKEYEDGLKEYEEGKEKFLKEIEKAQDLIEDGEIQLASLEKAEWHILNRYNTNYSFYLYINTCEQMNSIGLIIPLLFFVVAALVCSTTMTRLIDEQRGQIGIYSAIGFRKKEIRSIYLLYVVIASLSAAAVAVFAGAYMFPTVIYTTWRLMYDLPQINIFMPIDDLLICISCFTLLMMIVTIIVLNRSLKETSAQLLRPKAPKATKQILLEKWKGLWNRMSFTAKVTARNIFRYKGRFIMTVIGVAGCTSLLLMGYGIKDSISSVVDLQYGKLERYDYVVNLKNDRHIDEIISDIEFDKNNEDYIKYCAYNAMLAPSGRDVSVHIKVVDEKIVDKIFGLYDANTDEKVNLSNNGIFVSNKFSEVNNLKVGDELEIASYQGEKAKVKIDRIITNYVSDYIYMSENLYKQLFNEEIEYTSISVINKGDSTMLLDLPNVYSDVTAVLDVATQTKSFDDMLEALNLIIIVIIIVAGALAFVVLINLTNVNISERVREIATLKVLGFRKNEVNSYIFKEVLLMSIVGAIIGLPLGVLEERFIMTVIDMEMCTFPNIIFYQSYIYSFAITIIFTIIVLFITKKTLRNIEMIESLKSIE